MTRVRERLLGIRRPRRRSYHFTIEKGTKRVINVNIPIKRHCTFNGCGAPFNYHPKKIMPYCEKHR